MEQRGQGLWGLSWLLPAGRYEFLSCFLGTSYLTGFIPIFIGDKPTSKSMGFALKLLFRFSTYWLRNLNTAGLRMLLSASRYCSVLVVEGNMELDGETPDNVGVEIWSEHGVEEGFNCMIQFQTFNDGFKILDLWK